MPMPTNHCTVDDVAVGQTFACPQRKSSASDCSDSTNLQNIKMATINDSLDQIYLLSSQNNFLKLYYTHRLF